MTIFWGAENFDKCVKLLGKMLYPWIKYCVGCKSILARIRVMLSVTVDARPRQ